MTYSATINEQDTIAPLVSLNILYEVMPKTRGCEQCGEINSNDLHWCCRELNPSMYFVEFLRAWNSIQQWKKSRRVEIIIRAIKSYLSNDRQKGCIFYDQGCTIYNDRPYMCRVYGIIPQSTWDRRLEVLKEREKFNFRPQCHLVKTENDQPLKEEQDDKWFVFLQKQEKRLGIPDYVIKQHDNNDGSYRTFYDHILLTLFHPEQLSKLTELKQTKPSLDDINKTVESLRLSFGNL